ncbi:MAG: LapA family protein [Phycisphaeraceae bacterium]
MTDSKPRMSNAVKVKLIIGVVLLALVVVLIGQNWTDVETHIFFASVTMPRAILLTLMLLIGFAIGVIATWSYNRRR